VSHLARPASPKLLEAATARMCRVLKLRDSRDLNRRKLEVNRVTRDTPEARMPTARIPTFQ